MACCSVVITAQPLVMRNISKMTALPAGVRDYKSNVQASHLIHYSKLITEVMCPAATEDACRPGAAALWEIRFRVLLASVVLNLVWRSHFNDNDFYLSQELQEGIREPSVLGGRISEGTKMEMISSANVGIAIDWNFNSLLQPAWESLGYTIVEAICKSWRVKTPT